MTDQKTLTSFDLREYMDKHNVPGELITLELSTKTVVLAATALNVPSQQIIKSLVFIIDDEPVLLISAGTPSVDMKSVRNHFGVSRKKVGFAKWDEMLEITGYAGGTMPHVGHKIKLKTILDPSVMENHEVYGGGGDTNTMMKIKSEVLLEHTNAEIVDISR